MPQTENQIPLWPATNLIEAFESGELTPEIVMRKVLNQTQTITELHAFIDIFHDEAMAEAKRATWRYRNREALGPLDGLPVAVKDSFLLRGVPCRSGSKTTSPEATESDGPAVAAMRRAGAIFIGRTTMSEFGWKAVCDSPLTGLTYNPHNPKMTPGGSSGGDGVAVATGASALAIGADIGGSVRIPASFCGIVGIKPTHNRAPRHLGSHASVLSREGTMARSVADAALLLDVIERDDRADEASTRDENYYLSSVGRHIEGMKVGVMYEHPEFDTNPRIKEKVTETIEVFRDLGVQAVEVNHKQLDLGGYRDAYVKLLSFQYERCPRCLHTMWLYRRPPRGSANYRRKKF